jgi:hypothetical protein
MRQLGTPGPTQLLAGAVNATVMTTDGKTLLPVGKKNVPSLDFSC